METSATELEQSRQFKQQTQIIVAHSRDASILFASFVILTGFAVLAGWYFGSIFLQSIVPGARAMAPMTAFAFVLSGLAVLFFNLLPARLRWVGTLATSLVLLISILKLLAFAGIDFGTEKILFNDIFARFQQPSEMALLTAISFLFFGVALAQHIFAFSDWRRYFQYSVVVPIIVGFFGILEYINGTTFNSPILIFATMALHSSLLFLLLAGAVFFMKPPKYIVEIVAEGDASSFLFKISLPIALFVPLIIDILTAAGARNGFYDSAIQGALYTALSAILLEIAFLVIIYYERKIELRTKEFGTNAMARTQELEFLNATIAEKNKSLQETKISILNVIEDLQEKTRKIEEDKVKEDALLESIGEGMVAVDRNEKIIAINAQAKSILKISDSDVASTNYSQLWQVETDGEIILPAEKRPIYLSLSTGKKIVAKNYYYITRDNTKIPVSITVSPIMIGGKIEGVIDIFHDITREKEIERLRSDFLTLASHQLRTPLSGTKWLIETLQRNVLGPLNKKQNTYLDEIYKMNERMIKLVFDMLNVLRLESGSRIIKKESISATSLYRDLGLMLDSAAKSSGILLRFPKNGGSVVSFETDREALNAILECFLSNAINYSETGTVITLDVREEPEGIVFVVSDSGIGISAQEHEHIFERFYRASNAKTFKPEGTGLGLFMAKWLADKIGGTITFESEEDKGSKFYLRIPKKRPI